MVPVTRCTFGRNAASVIKIFFILKIKLCHKSLRSNGMRMQLVNCFGHVFFSGVCRRLVELLFHESHSVVSSALRAVGNIVTGNDIQTQVMFDPKNI